MEIVTMSKLIYSRNGSETTESIRNASPTIQAVWDQAHKFGANIVRVRSEKNRFGADTGRTFNSFHNGTYHMVTHRYEKANFRRLCLSEDSCSGRRS